MMNKISIKCAKEAENFRYDGARTLALKLPWMIQMATGGLNAGCRTREELESFGFKGQLLEIFREGSPIARKIGLILFWSKRMTVYVRATKKSVTAGVSNLGSATIEVKFWEAPRSPRLTLSIWVSQDGEFVHSICLLEE